MKREMMTLRLLMIKQPIVAYFSLILLLSLTACTENATDEITIASAANMQFAMQKITEAFTKQSGIDCKLVISSSGKLTAQIKAGAPYDVFIAADQKYPTELYESGFTKDKPQIYAYGKLVLWTMIDSLEPSMALLSTPSIQHIAMPNPQTAPYGVAAMEVLKHYQLQENVKPKLVYGESVSQTNRFINSKSAEIGFTAMAVVLSEQMQRNGRWKELEPSSYQAIEQAAIVVHHDNRDTNKARQFYHFLFSKEAKEILKKFGYLVNE